jgi:ubiquitin-protein ligase E3 A
MIEVFSNRFFWFQIGSTEDLSKYETLGKIVGVALYNQITLPTRFPIVMYKKLFNFPLNLNDYAEINPTEANSLKKYLQMKKDGCNISTQDLTFSTLRSRNGKMIEIDFIENGRNVLVTNDNLDLYIQSYIKYYLEDSIKNQFEAFKKGFRVIIKGPAYRLVSPFEFDILLAGEAHYDWEGLKRNIRYSDGYDQHSTTIQFLWEVFDEFSEDLKKNFLLFITGSPRAPIDGLSSLVITIQKGGRTSYLPTAHTCFNSFVLPDYDDKNILKNKLMIALENPFGFEIL